MTNYDQMSDREMDKLIEKTVFKRGYWRTEQGGQEICLVPHYSTNLVSAFSIVEHLRKQGRVVVVKVDGLRKEGASPYTVLIDGQPRTDGKSLCRTICLAALSFADNKGKL